MVGIDVGYFQINTHFHQAAARELGYDITEPAQNVAYGLHLLATRGTAPWSASRHCWGGYPHTEMARGEQ